MNTFNITSSQPVLQTTSQISVLEMFFPGFTGTLTLVQQLLTGNLNSSAQLFCVCGALVLLLKYAYRNLKEIVETHFMPTIYISYYNEVHEMVITWALSQGFIRDARSSLARVDASYSRVLFDHSSFYDQKALHFSPWNASFYFLYRKHLLLIKFKQDKVHIRSEEDISISCFGRSSMIVEQLLEECRQNYLERTQKTTSIFEHQTGEWKKAKAINIRPISTVIMNMFDKEVLLQDIKAFLDEKARSWYATRGFPYRRGFLLYGPPGTGKSSFSLSIAGHFKLDIYVLSLSSVNDSCLKDLLGQLPPSCVVLLEDVDVAGPTRAKDSELAENDHQTKAHKLSFSGLLNALDGVSSPEGQILIMTTNHPERLDDALIRPGRVDKKVLFDFTDKDINIQLFCSVYKETDTNGQGMPNDKVIEILAKDFASKVPEKVFSPAEVLSYLLEHRQSPDSAVDHIDKWVAKVRSEKCSIKRVDSLESDF